MILAIENILSQYELDLITSRIKPTDFVDGKQTAGWHARLVKQNTQLDRTTPYLPDLKQTVLAALQRNALFQSAVQPKVIHSLLVSHYEAGMSYGSHVDNALMMDGGHRSDISLTLFLNSPEQYEGGELVLEMSDGDRPYKLAAGSLLLYPSTYLHRVDPVTSGERLVVAGWVQSRIRDAANRELLFDLDAVRRALFAKDGKTTEFDLLCKTHANLLRQWAE